MSFHWEEIPSTRSAPICDVCKEEIVQTGGGPLYGPTLECGCGEGAWYVIPSESHLKPPLPQYIVDPFYVPWNEPERLGYHSLSEKASDENGD